MFDPAELAVGQEGDRLAVDVGDAHRADLVRQEPCVFAEQLQLRPEDGRLGAAGGGDTVATLQSMS